MPIELTVTPTMQELGKPVKASWTWDFGPTCLGSGEWVIDWGDGVAEPLPEVSGCSGFYEKEHIYASTGEFTVKVFAVWIDYVFLTHNEVSNAVVVTIYLPEELVVLPPPPPPRPPERPPRPEPPIEEPWEPEPEPPPPCGDLDAETFREFWRNWGHRVDKLAFEVPLDDGVDVPDLEEPWRSVWKKLTRHRIDVVFERKGVLYVAEIKPRLSIAAIGTAIVACTMFKQRYDVSRFVDVRPAVICQVGSPTLIQAAATHRVVIFLTRGIDGLYEPVSLHDVVW